MRPTQDRIKQVRKRFHLTQAAFGERIGVKGNTVTGWENGLRTPSEAIINLICREFGVSKDWLTTGKGDIPEQVSGESAYHTMVDRVMASENERVKQVFKGLTTFTEDDWKHLNDILDKLISSNENPEARSEALMSLGKKNTAAARSGDRAEAAEVSAEAEAAVLPPPYTGDI